jgi:hypothetical protein
VVGGWNLAISNITNAVAAVVSPIQAAWQAIRTGFESYIVKPIQSMWTSLMGFIKGALNGFLSGFGSAVNAMVGIVNQLVDAYNAIPIRPFTLSRLPTFTVPQFADGGVVSAPTLAMVGEGGEPEYIIPESKMAQASSNFMDGARGASVLSGRARQPQIITPRVMTWQEYNAELERTRKAIMKKESLYLAAIKKREALDKQAANKMREQMKMWEQMKAQGAATDQLDGVAIPASLPGYMRSTSVNAGLGATIKPEPTTVQINITTGPVLEFNDERWVKVKDLNRAMQQTADAVLGRMRTPRTRMALGAR